MKKALFVALAILAASATHGQQRQQTGPPHLGYVYPAGGQRGTTFEVVVGGQFLDGVTGAYLSGRGVRVIVQSQTRPLLKHEHRDLKVKLSQLEDLQATLSGRASRPRESGKSSAATNKLASVEWTPAHEKWMQAIRMRIASSPISGRQPTPSLAETVTLRITLSPDAEPGERELRLLASTGLTNPLKFFVGQLPEVTEKPFEIVVQHGKDASTPKATTAKEMRITLPATVNGQILPGGINRYRFAARQGQRLVAAASARTLLPYLPDTVPGWIQATMTLYDAAGNTLEYADHYEFSPDPVLYYEIPKDGDYSLEIRDSLYRGRDDFVYRITLGEQPFVVSFFPLGCPTDHQATVAVRGVNLPVNQLTLNASGKPTGTYPVLVGQGDGVHNSAMFAVDTLSECFEQETNNTTATAQPVTLPIIINGRINTPGDTDVFRFEGHAGQTIVAEVIARRLNSPMDSVITFTDAAGKQLGRNDDYEDKGAGLLTHQADSYLRITLPADGTYYLHLADTQHKGGPDYSYRLRLSAPRPDFQLRVTPSSLTARAGASATVTVYALRRDGFTNAIVLGLVNAPAGFQLSNVSVPANQDKVELKLTVPATPTTDPISLNLEGRALIDGQTVVRRAVPADDMMQAFAYRHLVTARDLKVAVTERSPQKLERILSSLPVKIPAGGTARVRITIATTTLLLAPTIELSDSPKGITLADTVPIHEGAELVLQTVAANVKPGQKGTLTVKILGERPGPRDQIQPSSNKPRATLATLPPIPFEIVAPDMKTKESHK